MQLPRRRSSIGESLRSLAEGKLRTFEGSGPGHVRRHWRDRRACRYSWARASERHRRELRALGYSDLLRRPRCGRSAVRRSTPPEPVASTAPTMASLLEQGRRPESTCRDPATRHLMPPCRIQLVEFAREGRRPRRAAPKRALVVCSPPRGQIQVRLPLARAINPGCRMADDTDPSES